MSGNGGRKKPASAATNLIGPWLSNQQSHPILQANASQTAGGGAGMVEALACHPLGRLHSVSHESLRQLSFQNRYDQSSHAAFQESAGARGTKAND